MTGVYGPAAEYVENDLPKNDAQKDPRFYAYFRGDLFVADFLDSLRGKTEVVRVEKIDDAKCAVVKVQKHPGRSSTIWIDMDHGFIIRKATESEDLRGREITLEELEVHSLAGAEASWLPSKLTITLTFWNRETGDRIGSAMTEVTLKRFAIGDEVPPLIFDVAFPKGTIVSDRFDEKEFIVTWADLSQLPEDPLVKKSGREE